MDKLWHSYIMNASIMEKTKQNSYIQQHGLITQSWGKETSLKRICILRDSIYIKFKNKQSLSYIGYGSMHRWQNHKEKQGNDYKSQDSGYFLGRGRKQMRRNTWGSWDSLLFDFRGDYTVFIYNSLNYVLLLCIPACISRNKEEIKTKILRSP